MPGPMAGSTYGQKSGPVPKKGARNRNRRAPSRDLIPA
jgi:hypothetical protein